MSTATPRPEDGPPLVGEVLVHGKLVAVGETGGGFPVQYAELTGRTADGKERTLTVWIRNREAATRLAEFLYRPVSVLCSVRITKENPSMLDLVSVVSEPPRAASQTAVATAGVPVGQPCDENKSLLPKP